MNQTPSTPPPPPSALREGEVFGCKYRAGAKIGEGATGAVFEASCVADSRDVAVEVLERDAANHPSTVARFLREAQAATRIHSDHAAAVVDVGTLDDGTPFKVTEQVDGPSFAKLLGARGAFGVTQAVDYLLQACEAVAEAHRSGIIHHNLEPSKLFLITDGDGNPCVKVVDFGVSKHTSDPLRTPSASDVFGNPTYMSPEQMRGARSSASSDVWALGAVLHEMLTATVAFPGESATAICAAVLQEPPRPIRAISPDTPEGLEFVVLHCLQKSPDDRYQDVDQLALALAPYASDAGKLSADRATRSLRNVSAPAPDNVPPISVTGHSRARGRSESTRKTLATWMESQHVALAAIALLGLVVGIGATLLLLPRSDPQVSRSSGSAATDLAWSAASYVNPPPTMTADAPPEAVSALPLLAVVGDTAAAPSSWKSRPVPGLTVPRPRRQDARAPASSAVSLAPPDDDNPYK